jgi:hypothetical protein
VNWLVEFAHQLLPPENQVVNWPARASLDNQVAGQDPMESATKALWQVICSDCVPSVVLTIGLLEPQMGLWDYERFKHPFRVDYGFSSGR